MNNRFRLSALTAVALALPVFAAGCSGDGDNPLCCNEFKVGGTIEANIGGSAQSQVAVQAVADVGAIAAGAVEDMTAACRAIAQDLDASKADQDGAGAGKNANEQMKAWCSLAVKQIGSVKATAGGTLSVKAAAPKCEASLSAKAECQGKCSGGAKCDFKANPPTCTGGKLSVSCKGSCKAEGTAPSVACEGSCSGECSGGCTVQGGIQCAGECNGTCEGAGGAGTSGVDASGKCTGTCKGTCSATPPGVTCSGSCSGSCKGECKATPGNASVKCDGKCEGEFEPISCEGGKLEGGCKVEAKCDANCNASVSAKANCTPPSVEVAFSGGANIEAQGKLIATLKLNLPLVFRLNTKLKAVLDASASFSGNISAVADIKAACIPALVAAAGEAVGDLKAAGEAAVSVTGSVGG